MPTKFHFLLGKQAVSLPDSWQGKPLTPNNTSSLPGCTGWRIEVGAASQGPGEEVQGELLIPIPILGGASGSWSPCPPRAGAVSMIHWSSCQPQVSAADLLCAGSIKMNKVGPLLWGLCMRTDLPPCGMREHRAEYRGKNTKARAAESRRAPQRRNHRAIQAPGTLSNRPVSTSKVWLL